MLACTAYGLTFELRLSEGLGHTARLGKSFEASESDRKTRVQLLPEQWPQDDAQWAGERHSVNDLDAGRTGVEFVLEDHAEQGNLGLDGKPAVRLNLRQDYRYRAAHGRHQPASRAYIEVATKGCLLCVWVPGVPVFDIAVDGKDCICRSLSNNTMFDFHGWVGASLESESRCTQRVPRNRAGRRDKGRSVWPNV